VVVHVGGWDLPATARPIVDPDARAKVFDTPETRWYSSQAERQHLIEQAPMIEILFDP
jgi:hypothetical protein